MLPVVFSNAFPYDSRSSTFDFCPEPFLQGFKNCMIKINEKMFGEIDGVAERSVLSFQTESQKGRFKSVLSEQIQINEKLEIENEMNRIKLRQAMKLLKSNRGS